MEIYLSWRYIIFYVIWLMALVGAVYMFKAMNEIRKEQSENWTLRLRELRRREAELTRQRREREKLNRKE